MTSDPGLRHDALLYASDAEFVAGVGSFVRRGLAARERTVVVEPPQRIDLLRAELGDDARAVEFFDMTDVGSNPARIVDVWTRLLHASAARGLRLRGVGEPAWAGRSAEEFVECRIHEHLLNSAFGDGATWELLCPYDVSALPRGVVEGAARTHPHLRSAAGRRTSAEYTEELEAVFGGELSDRPDHARRHDVATATIADVRRAVARFAASIGLNEERIADVVLTATELATNSLRHGAGGTVWIWADEHAVRVETQDNSTIDDPLVGRRRPALDRPGGRGLYLVNQVCDLVQIRSSAGRTRVRATLRHR